MAKQKTCKECGKEVSKSAKVCPNCGAKQKKSMLLKILISIFILVVILYVVPDGSSSEISSVETNQQEKENEIEIANKAYDSDDYATALPLYQKEIDKNTKDGVIWYRYAYSKGQIENSIDINAYLTAWNILREKEPDNPYFDKSAAQVISNIKSLSLEINDWEVGIKEADSSKSFGAGFTLTEAGDGAIFVKIVISALNTSSSAKSFTSVPTVRLYDSNGIEYERDNINSGIYNALIDNPLGIDPINPGLSKNLANIFQIPESKWQEDGWYIQINRENRIPIK